MMNTKKIQKYLLKIKESFLEESDENKKMLDIYILKKADEYKIDLIPKWYKALRSEEDRLE